MNNNKNLSSDAQGKYQHFEKLAKKNSKQTVIEFFGVFMVLGFALMYYPIYHFLHLNLSFWTAALISLVFAVGFAAVLVYIQNGGKNGAVMRELEATEGASDNHINHLQSVCRNPSLSTAKFEYFAIRLAAYHNDRGEYDKALELINRIPLQTFLDDPTDGHRYYAALFNVFVEKGNLEDAVKIYQDGSYFITKYMNTIGYSSRMRVAMANFEYLKGNYKMSIILLEEALKIENQTQGDKVSCISETLVSEMLYRIASSYLAIGDVDNASKTLKQTEYRRTTPYYRDCINKLYNELNANVQAEQ